MSTPDRLVPDTHAYTHDGQRQVPRDRPDIRAQLTGSYVEQRFTKERKSIALVTRHGISARPGVQVKLLSEDNELYVFAESEARVAKERGMRQRQLKWLWARLKQLAEMQLSREELLMRLGAARAGGPSAWRLVVVKVAAEGASFTFRLDRAKLRRDRLREGRYLLRTNLPKDDPAKLWDYYIRLVEVEQAFKTLKGDLAIRPVFHQREARIEAHILIAFLAFSLHGTLRHRLRAFAPGLMPRAVLDDDFAAVQMIDVHVPTTDGRELTLTRYTEPKRALRLLLDTLKLQLPAQPPPKITAGPAQPQTPM